MSLAEYNTSTPEFRTYRDCKRSSSGAGCTAAYAVSDLIETSLNTISIPPVFKSLSLPVGLAYRSSIPSTVCAEVETGKRSNLSGPSDEVISDSVFDRLLSLASVEGVKHKKKDKTMRRVRKGSSSTKRLKKK